MFVSRTRSVTLPSVAQLFGVWFLVIFVLKWPSLSDPPVWDAVFGLFPAAGELADNGFDLPSLLKKPNCRVGGPNTHSESIVTWITAGVLWLAGKGPRAFAILHLLHFGAAAWTLAVLHRFTIPLWGRLMAGLFTATLLLCPLFRVQVGAMYFEIPLAACTVAAVVTFSKGQLGRAVFWSTLGVLVKQAGLVVAGALALAALCQPGTLSKRFGRSVSFAASGLAAAFWPLVSTTVLSGVKDNSPPSSWWKFLTDSHFGYLSAIPDITAAFCLVAIIGLFRLREMWSSLTSDATNHSDTVSDRPADAPIDAESDQPVASNAGSTIGTPTRALGVSFLLVVMFALFFYVTPYFARLIVLGLPRYFVFILPFIFLALTHWLTLVCSPRRTAIVLATVAMLFFANRDGRWYPKDERDEISVLERGESYRLVVAAQREAAQTAANLPDDAVIYYGFEDHFFQKYSWLGYAHRTHPGGRALFLPEERPKSTKMENLPERFFVIYANPNLFGYEAHLILRSASKDPTRKVRLFRRCQRGPYRIDIYEVSTVVPPPQPNVAELNRQATP